MQQINNNNSQFSREEVRKDWDNVLFFENVLQAWFGFNYGINRVTIYTSMNKDELCKRLILFSCCMATMNQIHIASARRGIQYCVWFQSHKKKGIPAPCDSDIFPLGALFIASLVALLLCVRGLFGIECVACDLMFDGLFGIECVACDLVASVLFDTECSMMLCVCLITIIVILSTRQDTLATRDEAAAQYNKSNLDSVFSRDIDDKLVYSR